MLDMSPVYNHYSSVYQPQTQTKYDSHKRSELKTVYNNMVKVNQKSPLFKVSLNEQTQDYAIGLKSAAIHLKNFSEFLSDEEEDPFSKLMATSSDNQSLSASVITTDYDKLPESLDFTIENLATNQVNSGVYVNSNDLDIAPGNHSFSIRTGGRNYTFHLSVKDNDTNLQVQSRLSNFLNQADIGISAYVQQEGSHCQLTLESESTGTEDARNGLLFQIMDEGENGYTKSYELDYIAQYPEDANFTINSHPQVSSSNNIEINHMVEIELRNTSSDSITVNFIPDTEDTINKIKEFAGTYNEIVDIAAAHTEEQLGAKKLLHEIKNISNRHHSTLEAVGLNVDNQGYMKTDDALLAQSVSNGNIEKLFSDLSGFKDDLAAKTDNISLDPMKYVDKTVITYPNPTKTYTNPYMPSIYSGMLYNYYV